MEKIRDRNNLEFRAIIPAAGCSRRLTHLTRDKPKSFLDINGKKLIEYALDCLNKKGIRNATLIVGYKKEQFIDTIGKKRGGLNIDYVVSEDYETREHGWSLFLSGESWRKDKKDVLLMDADNFYEPALLDKLILSEKENVVLVNGAPGKKEEEEMVVGRNGIVEGLKRGIFEEGKGFAGEFIGMNKFSSEFMEMLYNYMENYFEEKGPNHKYERVLNDFIRDSGKKVDYIYSGGLRCININSEEDYEMAKELHRRIK